MSDISAGQQRERSPIGAMMTVGRDQRLGVQSRTSPIGIADTPSMRLLRRAVVLVAAISVAACSSTESTDPCVAVWGDVPVVAATVPDPADRPRIVLEELWRVGGSKVDQELAFPASFAVSSSGRVAVVDHVLAEVVVIEPDGRWLGPWARRGRGPGELTMPVAANWNGDTLVVFDIEQAKVSSYADGDVAGPDVRITPGFISPVSASAPIAPSC